MILKFIRSADNRIKQMTVKDLIVVLLAISALFACLLIWPLGAMKDTVVSSSGAETNQRTGNITEELIVSQTFIPQYDYIRSIGILLDRDSDNSYKGDFILNIFDASGARQRQVFSKIYKMNDMSKGYQELRVNLKVISGAPYVIQVSTANTDNQPIKLIYRTKIGAGPVENQLLYYDGQEIPDASIACSYTYGSPMGKRQIFVYYAFLLALFALAKALVTWLASRMQGLNKELTWGLTVRMFLSCGICWVWLFSIYYTFIRQAFGGEIGDFLIYGLGLGIALVVGLYAVWNISVEVKGFQKVKLPSLVRVLAFAVYFSLYAPYFNSGSNYGHYMIGCIMNIAFGIVLLTMFRREELPQWKNFIYSVVYWICVGGYFLYRIHDYNMEQRLLYIRASMLGWVWGLIVFVMLFRLCRRELQKVQTGYFLLIVLFFALTCIFRYNKYWPPFMALSFGILYLQKKDRKTQLELLRNCCQGAMVSFGYEVIYCLIHRPYHRYTFSRYPMQFSSVAMTGLYLLFIFVAIFVLLLEKYEKNRSLKNTWIYYLAEGVVLSYMFLSISRTAMLAMLVSVAAILIAFVCLQGKKGLRKTACVVGMLLLSFLIAFPPTYTMTRCVPAICDEPEMYPYEEFEDRILKGEEKDSYRYMNIRKFAGICFERFQVLMDGDVNLESFDEPVTEEGDALQQTGENESSHELTNGRLAIAQMYLKRLNWTGHDSVVITVGDTVYAHAHNSFIQVAYDHGILCGIVFLLLGAVTFIRSILFMKANYKMDGAITMMPLMILISFACAGIAEYVFLPVIPLGFGVLFVVCPLLMPLDRKSGVDND